MTFDELKPPDGGIRLIYDPESKGVRMEHAPTQLNRITMYGLLLKAQQTQPVGLGAYLPAINPGVQIAVSIVQVDGEISFAVSPPLDDVQLLGLLGIASEIVLGKRQQSQIQRPPQPGRIILQ